MQLAVPPDLSRWISERIAKYATEAVEPYQQWEVPAVRKFAALPLIRHWFETIGLRANGEVVKWSTDDRPRFPGVQPVEDRYEWLSAVVDAARTHPELQVLLPIRPSTASACRCVGIPLFVPGKVLCPECCGLQWVETKDAPPIAKS